MRIVSVIIFGVFFIINIVLLLLLLLEVRRKIFVKEHSIKIYYAFKKSKEINFSIISNVIIKKYNVSGLIKKIVVYDDRTNKLFSFLSTYQNSAMLLEKLKQFVIIT